MTEDEIMEEAYKQLDNHCYGCAYEENDSNSKPCNSCLQWVDGYLTATNFNNKNWDYKNERYF